MHDVIFEPHPPDKILVKIGGKPRAILIRKNGHCIIYEAAYTEDRKHIRPGGVLLDVQGDDMEKRTIHKILTHHYNTHWKNER